MNDWIVTLNHGNYGHATTDPNGDFLYTLFDGNYAVTLLPPNPYWSVCENNFQIDFTDTLNFDTAIIDFAVNAIIDCPYLSIDLTTLRLRRCFPSTYHAHYCNSGTIPADSAYVQIVLDTFLSFTGNSSIPMASQSGDTLSFLLGEVGVGDCGNFTFEVEVSCDAELGQTHCTEAHIFPDSLCIPPNNWSGAQIVVEGACQNDTIYFNIQNIGDAPTSQALDFVVIEDDVILMQGSVGILTPQSAEQYYLPATGATYRMEAEQEPNVPGVWSNPSSTVEACGLGNFSFGFTNQFPQDDASPFVDIDCRENVGSYDPNDKQAFPTGYQEEHFIYPNTDIEYLIRFQNTGTDTAFRVVIRDTLSAFLDPASVRPGASSHPYEFGIGGLGVLKFTFDDILLPDSTVNEAASHGFVKFRVSQKPFLPIGSVIENSAAIYFDFNAPVMTNTTWHTVGEDALSLSISAPGKPGLEAIVFPNPFSQKATIEWKGTDWPGENTFFLFDAMGRQVFAKKFKGNKLEVDGGSLQSGIYFYSVEVEGEVTMAGKLAVWK